MTLLAPLVALTCAIVTNVVFMIRQQVILVNLPSGVAESQVAIIRSVALDRKSDQIARHRQDLLALRAIPGVESASAADTLPLASNDNVQGMCATEQALMGAARRARGRLRRR